MSTFYQCGIVFIFCWQNVEFQTRWPRLIGTGNPVYSRPRVPRAAERLLSTLPPGTQTPVEP